MIGFKAVNSGDIWVAPDPTIMLGLKAPFLERETARAKEILKRFYSISPSTAQHYNLKTFALQHLTFRLILPPSLGTRNIEPQDALMVQSYIALSYRWQSNADFTDEQEGLPIPRLLFKAVLDECEPYEGVWIDQICINQDDEKEKSTTIPAMDIIYQRTRLVVIVITDFSLVMKVGQ